MYCYVSFTRTVSVPVPVTVLHCVNGDGPFDGQFASEPILSVNVNLTETGTETVRVNGS